MTMTNKLCSYPEIVRQPLAVSSVTLDASGERCGHVQMIKTAGDITKVLFYNAAVTSGDTIKVSIQTVSSGLPSGTLWNAGSYGTVAVSTGVTGWSTVTLGTAATVVQGDIIAVVFEYNSYVSGNMRFYGVSVIPSNYSEYVVTDYAAGSWTKNTTAYNGFIASCLEYSGGVYELNTQLSGLPSTSQFPLGTGTNPDEIGNYFQVPFTVQAYGIHVFGDLDYACTLSILDASNNTLASVVTDPNQRSAAAYSSNYWLFDTPVTLSPSTWYRMIVTPSSASTCGIYYTDLPSAAAMDSLEGGAYCIATSRVNSGAWTQLATRRWVMNILIDQIDIGGGEAEPVYTYLRARRDRMNMKGVSAG